MDFFNYAQFPLLQQFPNVMPLTNPFLPSITSSPPTSSPPAGLASPTNSPSSTKRIYYCQRCLNHRLVEPRRNHKSECPFISCRCEKCILVEQRHVLNNKLQLLEQMDLKETGKLKLLAPRLIQAYFSLRSPRL